MNSPIHIHVVYGNRLVQREQVGGKNELFSTTCEGFLKVHSIVM